jgi:hypothetical protein
MLLSFATLVEIEFLACSAFAETCTSPRSEISLRQGAELRSSGRDGIAQIIPALSPPMALIFDKAHTRTLFGEMICTADPGDAGSDDHDVEMLDLLRFGFGQGCRLGHMVPSRSVSEFGGRSLVGIPVGEAGLGRGI